MRVIYADQNFPVETTSSIFLAGPSLRGKADPQKAWRAQALEILEKLNFSGDVYIPEDSTGVFKNSYDHQVAWETEGLERADVILFWVPRDMTDLPGLTTNDEWGHWKTSGKCVFGAPPNAVKVSYQKWFAERLGVPIFTTLEDTITAATNIIGKGAHRTKGEIWVPLHIWQTASFQDWYTNQKNNGNILLSAHVEWILKIPFKKGPQEGSSRSWFTFFWVLKVDIFIAKEGRKKTNEVVIARNDISCVVVYKRGDTLMDTQVLLVREFRSPVNNRSGYVWELPGGSDFGPNHVDPKSLALEELHEEAGLSPNPESLKSIGSRQLMSTVSSHKANLFSLELDQKEFQKLQEQSSSGKTFGLIEDSEITYLEIKTVREITSDDCVDWATTGMILSTLVPLFN